MATSSSSSPFFGSREGDPYQQQQQPPPPPPSSSSAAQPQQKKKRSLPGTPSKYPDAEVIALSPKTLMATNRFICEVCNKGFQREQNLQLHRRGHNLPWKLRQKSNKDQVVRKKVYLCPETSCVHHDPARALGDLTGIKKHFSRKHGEKKFKCDKCSKRYAVQSDWKAHSKTCGTREYRCDCGTLFSRRDSFITHRAFCDALAQESARHPASLTTLFGAAGAATATTNIGVGLGVGLSQLPSLSDQTTSDIFRLGGGGSGSGGTRPAAHHLDHLLVSSPFRPQHSLPSPSVTNFYLPDHHHQVGDGGGGFMMGSDHHHQQQESQTQTNNPGGIFSNKLFPGQLGQLTQLPDLQGSSHPFNLGFFCSDDTPATNSNTNNTTNNVSTFYGGDQMTSPMYNTTGPSTLQPGNSSSGPHMSATALLQKAAQMGSTTSSTNPTTTILKASFSPSSPKPPPPSPPSKAGFGGLFGDHNDQNNFHDLMNSLTDGGGPWSGPQSGFNPNKSIMGGVGSSDRLTRDFLGVGEIMRSMSGGFATNSSQRSDNRDHHQQQQGLMMNNVNNNNGGATTTSTSQQSSFGGGGEF